ncbi:UNVERIFIED_CONTAM: hypothetical protein Sradi_0468700 [Sesamum radiatum]|uniref:Uncharacterized protein n=1 Tax=Sesamum radiatum TaxID=300843 RepID=A0AAW2W7F3_SESRA
MKKPSNTIKEQKAVETPSNTQVLQVTTGESLTPSGGGSTLLPVPSLPKAMGLVANPSRRNTSSDTSMDELSPAMLGVTQRTVSAAI